MFQKADIKSQWYPYHKIYEGFYDLSQTNIIPRKIMDYLLDMPNGDYTPIDDNSYARARLWKYLYYDGANPESEPLPTPQEKMSVLFDPDEPTNPPTAKGYRLIPQYYIKPSQTDGQTRIYVYMGRTIAETDLKVQLSVVFDIWTHYTEEASTKISTAYSRVFSISQALMQALHGVNIAGIGTFYFNRSKHPDCTDSPFTDKNSNVGRHLVFGLEIGSESHNSPIENNGIRLGNGYMG